MLISSERPLAFLALGLLVSRRLFFALNSGAGVAWFCGRVLWKDHPRMGADYAEGENAVRRSFRDRDITIRELWRLDLSEYPVTRPPSA